MEREACRAAMFPMGVVFGLPFVLCLFLMSPAGLLESSPLLARCAGVGTSKMSE